MMDMQTEADKWFSHLAVDQRFVMCGKLYPDSTRWWNSLTEDEQNAMYKEYKNKFDVAHYKVPKNQPSFT